METGNPTNYFRNVITDITAEEFELLCLELLQKTENFDDLKDVVIKHNVKLKGYDGKYQIDGYAEYVYLGVKIKVIVECKRYKRNVERSKITDLHRKVQSLGAQKGILISTAGFQPSAVKYAKVHGLALLQVVDGTLMTIQNSLSPCNANFNNKKSILMYNLDWDFPAYNVSKDSNELENFMKTI